MTSLNSLNSLDFPKHNMSPSITMPQISSIGGLTTGQETLKYEQKKMTSASKTKVK